MQIVYRIPNCILVQYLVIFSTMFEAKFVFLIHEQPKISIVESERKLFNTQIPLYYFRFLHPLSLYCVLKVQFSIPSSCTQVSEHRRK